MLDRLKNLILEIWDGVYHQFKYRYGSILEFIQSFKNNCSYFWVTYLEKNYPRIKKFIIWSYDLFLYRWHFYILPFCLTILSITWMWYPLPPEVFGPLLLTLILVSFFICFIVWIGENYPFLRVLHDKFMLFPLCLALYFPCCFGGWLWFESPGEGFSNWRDYGRFIPYFLKLYQPFSYPSFTFGYFIMIVCFWIITHMTFYQYIRYMVSFQDAFLYLSVEEDDKFYLIWEEYEREFFEFYSQWVLFFESIIELGTYVDLMYKLIDKLRKK